MFTQRPERQILAIQSFWRRWLGAAIRPAALVPGALLLLGGPAAGAAGTPDYFPRVWRTENGLPDNAVTAMVQTHDGYLWLATYGGLARFDGVSFTGFNTANTPELQSDRTTCLFEDADGALWIGHERGDLTCLRHGQFTAREFHETGNRRKISFIGSDGEGDVWMLDEEGTLVRARDGATCALPNQDGVVLMAQPPRGQLWVASAGRLASLEHGRLVSRMGTNAATDIGNYIQGIGAGRDGGLWIVSDGRVRKRSGGAWVEDRGRNPCNSSISRMIETTGGTLALGTVDDGLYLIFPNREVRHFSQTEGLPHNWIRCLMEDREGTLWIGAGSGGLVALRPGKVQTLFPPDHWQGRVPLSVTTARDGALWVGTEGAGLYRFQDGQWTNFDRTSGFGARIDPFTGRYAFHPGIDFAGPWGSVVHATAPGTVVFAGNRGGYGNMVEIDHGYGIHTRYGHLSMISVRVGTRIAKGAALGRVGSTGRSTGPHVHYEVWYDDVVKNPNNFIEAGRHVL